MSKYYIKRVVKNNMHLPSREPAAKRRWSKEDMKYLLDNHFNMYIDDIAAHVGRTLKATQIKAFRMGCSFKSKGNK